MDVGVIGVGAVDGAEDRIELLQQVQKVDELVVRYRLQAVRHVRRNNGGRCFGPVEPGVEKGEAAHLDDLLDHLVVREAQIQRGVSVRLCEQQLKGFEACEGESVARDSNSEGRSGGSKLCRRIPVV